MERITVEIDGVVHQGYYTTSKSGRGRNQKVHATVFYKSHSDYDGHGLHIWQLNQLDVIAQIILGQLVRQHPSPGHPRHPHAQDIASNPL
jgi:hypothetical protein